MYGFENVNKVMTSMEGMNAIIDYAIIFTLFNIS